LGLTALAAGCASAPETIPVSETPVPAPKLPLVIAHRGASGERPEHTLAAYALGIAQGADFIEPDLVLTKDGVLVCRHENEIGSTTDVADRPEFAARRKLTTIDGETVTGWFTEDFTLAELKTLRARERLPLLRPANARLDGQETIPTFAEMLALVAAESARLGRPIGVYPETKHPTHFDALGLSHDDPLLADLAAHGFGENGLPVFIQSFEIGNLRRLASKTRVPLVQLIAADGGPADRAIRYRAMLTPEALRDIATYADGIGVEKALAFEPEGALRIAAAHEAGLVVHAWTARAENYFLPERFRRGDPSAADFLARPGDMQAEVAALFALGVDGVFTDNPALLRTAPPPPG
jgi:glycerophosphoryl diester phosphodiesterase